MRRGGDHAVARGKPVGPCGELRPPRAPHDLGGAEGQAFACAARAAGVPVNVVDKPSYCDFRFGTIVNRSPVVIGISTDGAAPILGQAIRRRIETLLPPALVGASDTVMKQGAAAAGGEEGEVVALAGAAADAAKAKADAQKRKRDEAAARKVEKRNRLQIVRTCPRKLGTRNWLQMQNQELE